MIGFRPKQPLTLLLLVCLAVHSAQAFFLKKDKSLDWFGQKKNDEFLKKLDFLNLFSEKKEDRLEKIEENWEKLKEWLDEKKLKELDLFAEKKEKKEELDAYKKSKKLKPKKRPVYEKKPYGCGSQEVKPDCEEKEEEEEEEEEEVTEQYRNPCKHSNSNKRTYQPTFYDVREEDGERYFS